MRRAILCDDDDGLMPVAYKTADLIRAGFVFSRSDLARKINTQGFPAPMKPPGAPKQTPSVYDGPSVREWQRQRRQRALHEAREEK